MVEIKVPVISTEGKVGYVVRWYKNDGDEVKEGEEIAEVMIERPHCTYRLLYREN